MATASAPVCPVVGTKNTILPPSHPDFDTSNPDLVCPITNASLAHHQQLHKHPGLPSNTNLTAESCPALSQSELNKDPQNAMLDEGVCPVVGPVSTVLPPSHPPTDGATDKDVCPVTKASLKHHVKKVHAHPSVEQASEGAVCPVVGAKA